MNDIPASHFPLAYLGNLMGMDGLVVLIVAILIFGRKLPEVGRNLAKVAVDMKNSFAPDAGRDEILLLAAVMLLLIYLVWRMR